MNVINKVNVSCIGASGARIVFDNEVSEDILKKIVAVKLKFKPIYSVKSCRFGFGESSSNVFYYYRTESGSEIETLVPINFHSNYGVTRTSSFITVDGFKQTYVINAVYTNNSSALVFYSEYESTLSYIIVDLWYI